MSWMDSIYQLNPLLLERAFAFCAQRNRKMFFTKETIMHNEEDPSWGRCSAECMKNITREFIESLKEGEKEAVAHANATERVFTDSEGNEQILWGWGHGTVEPCRDVYIGWREKRDGTREKVWYYYGHGWMTSDELSEERQLFPRTAP